MGGLKFCSESEARELVLATVALTDSTRTVFVYKRELIPDSFTYKIEFGIRTREGNSEMVLNFLKLNMQNNSIEFARSEMHIQDGNLETDYIFVSAEITPNLGQG